MINNLLNNGVMNNSVNGTISEKTEINKKGDIKHYSPANKEWKNSVYSYKKNFVADLSIKDSLLNKIVKNFFRLLPSPKRITKSRRMRALIRRSTTKNIFLSKSEIKQTNDKAIINVHMFDRQRQFFTRKLFYLNRWLLKNVSSNIKSVLSLEKDISSKDLTNSRYLPELFKEIVKDNSAYSNLYNIRLLKRRKHSYRHKRRIHLRKMLSKFNINIKSTNILSSILKKRNFLKNVFFFRFMVWSLSLFNYKIKLIKCLKNKVRYSSATKNDRSIYNIKLIIGGKSLKITSVANHGVRSNIGNENYNKVKINGQVFKIINIQMKSKNYSSNYSLNKINILLLQYLTINFKNKFNSKTNQEKNIYLLFKYFQFRYYKKFMRKYLRRELLALRYLSKLDMMKNKFNSFMPGLKNAVNKIYNKKIELNIINLKYIHLNSDTFVEAITTKLARRKHKLLKIIRKSLKLVNIPFEIEYKNIIYNNEYNNINYGYNNLFAINKNTTAQQTHVTNTNYKDRLSSLFNNMFPHTSKYIYSVSNTLKNNVSTVLNTVKSKWITGARIETKGRLTKRFKASRALYKFKYKGNLKNLEKYENTNFIETSPSVKILRGVNRPNLQHTFAKSNRRIGAFGVNGWISSY